MCVRVVVLLLMNFQVYVTFLSSTRIFFYQLEVKTGFERDFQRLKIEFFKRSLIKFAEICAQALLAAVKKQDDRVDVVTFIFLLFCASIGRQ